MLFLLSFPYVLFQSFCYHANERGFHSDIGFMILFTGLIYLFLPLTGLFAVKDYNKNPSKKIDVCRERNIFLSLLALNVLFTLGLGIIGAFIEPIAAAYPIVGDMYIPEILMAAPYFISSVLQLLVWLISLIRTRSIIFGFGLATFVILTVSSLDSLMYWFEVGASV